MPEIKVDKDTVLEACEGYSSNEFALEHEGEWVQDYKYQMKDYVLKRRSDDTFWKFVSMRTGSPFTDYHYIEGDMDEVTLFQVEAKKIVTTKWALV